MLKFYAWLVEAGWVEKVTLLFLVKGHTQHDCNRMFNLFKHDLEGEDIWMIVELDMALAEKNEAFIDLEHAERPNWKDLTVGLNEC